MCLVVVHIVLVRLRLAINADLVECSHLRKSGENGIRKSTWGKSEKTMLHPVQDANDGPDALLLHQPLLPLPFPPFSSPVATESLTFLKSLWSSLPKRSRVLP